MLGEPTLLFRPAKETCRRSASSGRRGIRLHLCRTPKRIKRIHPPASLVHSATSSTWKTAAMRCSTLPVDLKLRSFRSERPLFLFFSSPKQHQQTLPLRSPGGPSKVPDYTCTCAARASRDRDWGAAIDVLGRGGVARAARKLLAPRDLDGRFASLFCDAKWLVGWGFGGIERGQTCVASQTQNVKIVNTLYL